MVHRGLQAVVAAIVLAASGQAVGAPKQDLSLRTRAHRLAYFPHWPPKDPTVDTPSAYTWLADGTILETPNDGSFYILNPSSGTDTKLSGRPAAVKRMPGYAAYGRYGLYKGLSSPDGNWLLFPLGGAFGPPDGAIYEDFSDPFEPQLWVAARTDGSRLATRRRTDVAGGDAIWEPSGSGWIELAPNGKLSRVSLGTRENAQDLHIRLADLPALDRTVGWSGPDQLLVLQSTTRRHWQDTTELLTIALDKSRPVRSWVVSFHGGDVGLDGDAAVSPDGHRIAWIVSYASGQRSMSSRRAVPNRTEIWITNVDGSGARELLTDGVDLPDPKDVAFFTRNPSYVQWTPDGKQISVLYDNALWLAPAQ